MPNEASGKRDLWLSRVVACWVRRSKELLEFNTLSVEVLLFDDGAHKTFNICVCVENDLYVVDSDSRCLCSWFTHILYNYTLAYWRFLFDELRFQKYICVFCLLDFIVS